MSNRVRILFHCALEGPRTCHVGNRALVVMEKLVRQSYKNGRDLEMEWVCHDEWIRRGRPLFARRALDIIGPGRQYLVPRPSSEPAQPAPKTRLERVKWLWENIPLKVRAHCQLKLLREARKASWMRSPGNPRYWGWQTSEEKPKPATQNLNGGIISILNIPPGGTLWYGPGETAAPAVGQSQPSPAQSQQPKPQKYKKARLKYHKNPYLPKLKDAFEDEFMNTNEGQSLPKASQGSKAQNTKAKVPPEPSKPKIKIGIWS